MVKIRKCTNLFIVAVTEPIMLFFSMRVMSLLMSLFGGICTSEAIQLILWLSLFSIPIIVCLIYMKITYHEKLALFIEGGAKRSIGALGTGLLIGFIMNLILCILASVSGSVKYSFVGFDPLLLAAVIPCFIQCSAEEVLLRGYVSSYLEDRYQHEVVAFIGGALFIVHHTGNLKNYGFDAIFCLNIFLLGIVLYLAMKLAKSIWIAFGIHTAWNYTQSFIFGSENSGMDSALAFYSSSDAKDTFYCNTVYGNEGTYMCVILLLITIMIMCFILKQRFLKTLRDGQI